MISFSQPTTFAAGSQPYSVTTADFNGDGKTDLATANHNSNNVSVLLGDGHGGFGSQTTFAAGNGPLSVTTADFNGDGKADLATANRYSNDVSVLLGDGHGGFGSQTTFAAGSEPSSVTTADFNGDGKTDLATANPYSNNVSVLLGDGHGGFGSQYIFGVGSLPISVATADLNGDGKADLVTLNSDSTDVSVLLGDGHGGFGPQTTFPNRPDLYSVTTADFNGDGKIDLATANVIDWSVSVLLGDGSGALGMPTLVYPVMGPMSVTTGDFNGDGKSDLATANVEDDSVAVLLNTTHWGDPAVVPATFPVTENSLEGTVVGTVTACSENPLSFTISAGNSDPDGDGHPAFSIDSGTGRISVNDPGDLDFETTSQFSLTVTATDPQGHSGSGPVTVTLTNVDEPGNQAPMAQDATFTLPESSPDGTAAGTVTAIDVDAGDTLTYTISAGNSDPDGDGHSAFAINTASGQITVNDRGDLDFETTPTFNLRVEVTDAGGLSDTANIKVNLANVNESPSGISLSADQVNENVPANTVIGTLGSTDPDVGDTFTYSLVAGDGATDNSAFVIDGDQLRIKAAPDFESQSEYRVRVRTTDQGGLFFEKPLTIHVNIANDDYSADTSTSGSIAVGSLATGVIEVSSDVDWFRATLLAGVLYQIDLEGSPTSHGTLDDPYFRGMYDNTGAQISGTTDDDSGAGFNSRLSFAPLTTGTYYLAAGAYTSHVGSYALSVTQLGFVGTPGDDILAGNTGDNVLSGGAGNDRIDGGAGTDYLREQGDVDFTLTDGQLTGLGTDTLAGIERALLTGGAGNNRIDASGFNRGPVMFDGGAGDDTLIAPTMAGSFHLMDFYYNILTGGDGNDTLTGGAGVDCVKETGDVNFTLTDSQLTGRGTDHLSSIELANLIGGPGDNRLDVSGFTGSLTMLEGKAGNDTLFGGAAVDWVRAASNTDFTLTDTHLTGLGTNTLHKMDRAYLSGGDGDNRFDASAFTGDLVILDGRGGNDTLIGRDGGIDCVHARGDVDFTLTDSQLTGQGTDTLTSIEQADLTGGAGNNHLDASAFSGSLVTLEGGGGDDTLIGRAGGTDLVRARGNVDFTLTDTQLTGLGTDTLVDIDRASLIGDGDGNTLDASAFTRGPVSLWGESGDDILKGGVGNDRLIGGPGNDTLSGGTGIDRVEAQGDTDFTLTATQLIGLGTDSLDSIEQAYLCGGPRDNVLDASAFTGSLVILEGQGGNDTLIGRANGIDRVRAQGDINFTLTDNQLTGLGTDTLTSIEQADLTGYSGDNVFDASGFTRGPVTLSGGGGDDTLLGGSGGDRLDGGQGNDLLAGGLGKDSLLGGLGADVFKYDVVTENGITNALRDVIKDFDFSQGDKIDLSALDADTGVADDQAFTSLTQGGTFSGVFASPGELYFDQWAHILHGNNDADSAADFSIELIGVSSLSVTVLVL